MKLLALGLICTVLLVPIYFVKAKEYVCGFPGTPAYGSVKPDQAAYEEGDVVTYSCRVGYILLGSPIGRCTDDGSWSEDVPICDDSMTTLGVAFSTPSVPGYPAEYAIDRDKSTCTKLKERKPRWWRIDLGNTHKVLSVAVTIADSDENMKFSIFVIKILDGSASYKRCASFSGKFGTQTMVMSCAEGKGIEGEKVHIEDHIQKGEFQICEVEVQVEKDTGYECGRPSRNLNSITFAPRGNRVDYGCIQGYEIIGKDYRKCLSTGHWSDLPPICTAILCDELEDLEDGHVEFSHDEGPILEGTIAIYTCKKGYRLEGPFTRNCQKDGTWSGRHPKCRAIRCPLPDGKAVGGVYRLVNNTNSMGSMALLRCKKGKREGDNPYITCTEESVWTEPEAKCILPAGTFSEQKEEPRIANQGAIIFGMIVAAIMIVVVLVSMYVYTQKRRNGDKPEVPSRLAEPLMPPPRPPPRGDFKSALMGLISRDSSDKPDDQKELQNSWYGGSGSKSPDDPAVIEVEVIAQEDKRKGVYPVPEENENTSLENVVLDVDEKSSDRAASPKDQKSTSDYAAVDYEKKRQSRLLKDQDSIDSSSTAAASPIPPDESEKKGKSPIPKSDIESEEESEEEEEEEDENEKRKQEEERKAQEEAESKAKEEEKKAKEEAEKKAKEAEAAPGSRRRRLREEPPPPVVEERPALRRVRQSRFQ